MRDIDSELKDVLQRMAGEIASAPGMPKGVWRASMLRRTAAIALGGVLTVGTVLGAASLSTQVSRGDSAPVATTATEEEGQQPESMSGGFVAEGESEGITWWLTAFKRGAEVCTQLAAVDAKGIENNTENCSSASDGTRYPIGLSSSSDRSYSVAAGRVPGATETLELLTPGSEPVPLTLYDAPPELAVDNRFFVIVPYDDEVSAQLIAFDSAGDELGKQDLIGTNDLATTETVVRDFVIEDGEHENIPYLFKGHVDRQDLPDGTEWFYPCTELTLGEGERYGGGGGCHIPLARGHDVNYSLGSFADKPDIVPVSGATSPRVDRVTVELSSGEVLTTRMYDVEETEFRFFVVFLDEGPLGTPGEVVAYSGSVEVDRVELCGLSVPGGTCGP